MHQGGVDGKSVANGERRPRSGAWAALALSAFLHILVAMALLRPPALPISTPPRSVEVQLFAPARDREPSDQRDKSRAQRKQTKSARADARPAPAPQVFAAPEALPNTVPPVSAMVPAPGPVNLQRALRGAMGCSNVDLLNLSPTERQTCRDQLAQRLAARPDKAFGADPGKTARFAAEAKAREPFLARTPKDNCVPRLTDQEVGMGSGAAHDTTFGIACAKSF